MNRGFLQLYEQELRHIRERAAEFAAEYPKIAARLSLNRDLRDTCPDPFVERLLEGFAYLTARVQWKLEAEFPRFTQGILETVYPDYLAPGPSSAIVTFEPEWSDKALLDGVQVPRGSSLQALKPREESTACTFTTAHTVTLLPLDVSQAEYHTRTLPDLFLQRVPNLNPRNVRAAIRIRLSLKGVEGMSLAKLAVDSLDFFLHGEDRLPAAVLELILTRSHGVLVHEPGDAAHRRTTFLPRTNIRHKGFGDDEAMLPQSPRTFEGHRILREYFLLPQRLLFLEITGLQQAVQAIPGREFELIFPLSERQDDVADFVKPDLFRLYSTPAVNLFHRRADRVPLTQTHSEYQVIVDRTRMLDYEIYSIERVTGYGKTSNEQQEFYPFYLQQDRARSAPAFYTVRRERRALSERERRFGAHSSYPGSEVFLSLVDAGCAPFRPEMEQLGVACLCTNRHLPLTMPVGLGSTDFIPANAACVSSVRCLVRPTPPQASFAEGRFAWRTISHLSLNHLSLLDRGEDGASALREILRLYAPNTDAQRLVDGLLRVSSKPGLARSPGAGPVSFVRGIDIDLTLDELKYAGQGVFLFAAALEQFLARCVSINAFTRLTLRTEQRGELHTWPPRTGRIPLL